MLGVLNASIQRVVAYVIYAHMIEAVWLFCEFNIPMNGWYHGTGTL